MAKKKNGDMEAKMAGLKRLLETCSNKFMQLEQYRQADICICHIIEAYPRNIDLTHVLTKVVLIDSLYRTQLNMTQGGAHVRMAQHIQRIDGLDDLLKEGDLSAVERIRRWHGLIRGNNPNGSDEFSFATKYAAWHAPNKYPLADKYAVKALRRLLKDLRTSGVQIQQCHAFDTLKQCDNGYSSYREAIDALITQAGLDDSYKYKKIDQSLWLFGKIHSKEYKESEIPNGVVTEINKAAADSVK